MKSSEMQASVDFQAVERTLSESVRLLLSRCAPGGHWEGRLADSALSTATACFALALAGEADGSGAYQERVRRGLRWLAEHQNGDGGWGDTVLSPSNISTTALAWSALSRATPSESSAIEAAGNAETWLKEHAGGLQSERLTSAISRRYGEDRTFSVPIVSMCILAGRLNPDEAWPQTSALPFEWAAFPARFFRWLRLPVVSYALPALIALGQLRHFHSPSANPVVRQLRERTRGRTLNVLESIQPPGGGFLEAAPLTSFVVMSLASIGQVEHPVARRGVKFLLDSVRENGSWPIDTNLATWVTTLSVNALAREDGSVAELDEVRQQKILGWLLDQQFQEPHPFTQADPGGWAWTDLSGGVPDADDTSGALLALANLSGRDEARREAAAKGIGWLLGLQNRDGGVPTFCRGWGRLPFDRSTPDITAHAIRAWRRWQGMLSDRLETRVAAALKKAYAYLLRSQSPEGFWLPIWFGSHYGPDESNPVYGTGRVLTALAAPAGPLQGQVSRAREKGIYWLLAARNPDGGWGGVKGAPSTIEETAVALEGLAAQLMDEAGPAVRRSAFEIPSALKAGVQWLERRTEGGTRFAPSPIGLYFARLFYFEDLYPLAFSISALNRIKACRRMPGIF
jgi:squalene-hopene/tetraprenyl-beta-curcumene cyclase